MNKRYVGNGCILMVAECIYNEIIMGVGVVEAVQS